MRKLTIRIKDDWTMRTAKLDQDVLKSYAERGKFFTVAYTGYLTVTLVIFLILPLIPIISDVVAPLNQSRDKVFFFQSEFFVDQDDKYFYIMIHSYFAMPIALGVIIAYDSMYAVHVQHACGIFATMGTRLQSIGGDANNNKLKYKDPTKRTDKAYNDIVACIKMHNEAVEVANLIESSGCISLFFGIGASMLTTTVTGFMTVKSLDQPSEALRFGICALGDLIHLFYICWQGHMLIEHSQDIFINAYNVDWYDMSPRAKKLLILIMLRSFEPCKLTAGKVFVLSMDNYAVLIKFIECLGDLNGMVECLPLLGVHLRSVAKLINNSVKVTKMRKLTNRIKDDWTVRINLFDEAILRPYAERGRLLTVIYVVYMYSTLAAFLSIPMIPIILDVVAPLNQTRERVVFFQTEYFVDQEEKYFYLLIHAIVVAPLAISIFIANDTMYAVYVHHACSIFAALGARLQSIGGIANNNEVEMYKDAVKRKDEAYNNIVICIKLHNEAVEVAELIESSSSLCLLFVVGSSMFTLTVTGFMTVTNVNQPGEALRFGFVAIGELIHLFYICWQGQMLMEHSEDIFLNAYNVNWCDISLRSKKLLLLIMLRSFEPCKLTAGKVFILSMENFAASLKTSMSYFTVLLSMQ